MIDNVGAECQTKHIPSISLCLYCYTCLTGAPSTAALSYKKPASAETTCDSCCAQESDKAKRPVESELNPLKAELNPICHLLTLLGGATIVVVSRLTL
jgi:hypothetical protein